MGTGTDLRVDGRTVAVASWRIRRPRLQAERAVTDARRIPGIYIFRAVMRSLLPRAPVHPDLHCRDRRSRFCLNGDSHLSGQGNPFIRSRNLHHWRNTCGVVHLKGHGRTPHPVTGSGIQPAGHQLHRTVIPGGVERIRPAAAVIPVRVIQQRLELGCPVHIQPDIIQSSISAADLNWPAGGHISPGGSSSVIVPAARAVPGTATAEITRIRPITDRIHPNRLQEPCSQCFISGASFSGQANTLIALPVRQRFFPASVPVYLLLN